jgi:hypothetical protein
VFVSDIKLGQLASEDAQNDAIHVPVAPVITGERLNPGEKVTMSAGKAFRWKGPHAPVHGVVDPWLGEDVPAGERIILLLSPGSVTAIRHDWTHPAFAPALSPLAAALIAGASAGVADKEDELHTLRAKVAELEEELEADGCRGCGW